MQYARTEIHAIFGSLEQWLVTSREAIAQPKRNHQLEQELSFKYKCSDKRPPTRTLRDMFHLHGNNHKIRIKTNA